MSKISDSPVCQVYVDFLIHCCKLGYKDGSKALISEDGITFTLFFMTAYWSSDAFIQRYGLWP